MPKSAIFTRPCLSSSTFSGLMSRCTMPWSCANCSASQIFGTMASASSGASLPRLQQLPQGHAVHVFHQQVVQPVGLAEVVAR